jgi:hypothetical protein
MTDKNTSHLAGEFLVAGELARRGYAVSITLGNAKSVDIYVETGEYDERGQKRTIRVDAKAARTKSWVIGKIDDAICYIFVYLRTKNQISKNEPPQFFVARGNEIKKLTKTYGLMQEIPYNILATTEEFQERWDKLPPP